MAINEEKMNQLLVRFVDDFGAVFHGAMVVIGDKLGLYKAVAETGPLTPKELADRTGTAERYVREWLASQAAGGYVTEIKEHKLERAVASHIGLITYSLAVVDSQSQNQGFNNRQNRSRKGESLASALPTT